MKRQILCIVFALFVFTIQSASCTDCHYITQRVQCGDLSCDKDKHVCVRCQLDSDCYPQSMRCNRKDGTCSVSPFFSSFGVLTVASMLFAFLICSVAVLAGVGGGGILVPMFTGMLSLPMSSSVGLSQSTICGQSTLNVFLAVQKHFPDPNSSRPLINYQYLSLLLPLGLIGTLVGGQMSKLSPDWVRLLLLFVLLSTVLQKTIKKMIGQYRMDKEAKQATVQDASPLESEQAKESNADPAAPAFTFTGVVQPQYPQFEITTMLIAFLALLFSNIIRGYSECGSVLYFACLAFPLIFLSILFWHCRQRLETLSNESPESMTFVWNEKTSIYFPMVAVIAGAAAAMLGIGGGLVLGFILYEVGLIPEEASVTGGMATFFIAFSSALQLIVQGNLVLDYGFVFFLVGMASTALGQFYFMSYIKAHGLKFLIVGSLALIVGGSLVVLSAFGIYTSVQSVNAGGSLWAFGSLCPAEKH